MSKIAVKMSEATNAIVNLGRTLDNEKKKKKNQCGKSGSRITTSNRKRIYFNTCAFSILILVLASKRSTTFPIAIEFPFFHASVDSKYLLGNLDPS